MARGFFSRQTTETFCDDLLTALREQCVERGRRFVIFTGAGVSADRGAPTWNELTESLLQSTVGSSTVGSSTPYPPEAIAAVVASNTPLAVSSAIFDHVRHNDLQEMLVSSIQAGINKRSRPQGQMAFSVGRLAAWAKLVKIDVEVVTTNFDTFVEKDLREAADASYAELAKDGRVFASLVPGEVETNESEIPVWHLHGLLGDRTTPLMFAEPQYANLEQLKVAEDLLADKIRGAVVLFVGTSLRDSYIVSVLARERDKRAFALFSREDALLFGGDGATSDLSEWVIRNRLRSIGIEPVFTDYLGQLPQLVDEIAYAVQTGHLDLYTGEALVADRYGGRIGASWNDWDRSSAAMVERQRAAHDALLEFGRTHLVPGDDGEQWRIELWVRDPPKRVLEFVANSDYLIDRTGALPAPLVLDGDDDHPAIRTFRRRIIWRGPLPPGAPGSRRWAYYLGLPVRAVRADDLRGVPMGVVCIFGSGRDRSFLDGIDLQPLRTLGEQLEAVCRPFLPM